MLALCQLLLQMLPDGVRHPYESFLTHMLCVQPHKSAMPFLPAGLLFHTPYLYRGELASRAAANQITKVKKIKCKIKISAQVCGEDVEEGLLEKMHGVLCMDFASPVSGIQRSS